ncbi:MAG: hypothetical protein GY870_12795 [archaeon]|nr:hypothetical protein [archaeon]
MKKYKDKSNNRLIFRMRASLISTSLWGILEAMILSIIGFIDRKIWPNFHTRFMRLLHGRMGGIITPSTIELEHSHENRIWKNRTPFKRVDEKGILDPKGKFIKKNDVIILPTQEILNFIIRSNVTTTFSYCYCRQNAKKHGELCSLNAPIQVCMTLSIPQAVEDIRNNEPKQKLVENKEKLYNVLRKCEEIGLVHQVIFFEQNSTYVVCNCCPCCCIVLNPFFDSMKEIKYHQKKIDKFLILSQKLEDKESELEKDEIEEFKKLKKKIKYHKKAVKMEPTPIVIKSAFISENINPNNCNNCGICESRCYFGARKIINGIMEYNSSYCYGCGLCTSTCPENNIILKKRSKIKKMAKNGVGIKHEHPHSH